MQVRLSGLPATRKRERLQPFRMTVGAEMIACREAPSRVPGGRWAVVLSAGSAGDDDAVPTGVLGRIKRLVGDLEQLPRI